MKGQKKSKMLILFTCVFAVLTILSACTSDNGKTSSGEDYPKKAINAISPWSAGSGSDIAFRGYAKYVAEELGQNINVQNITGGNGAVGWAEAAAADADGYNMALLTFDVLTNEALGVSATTYKDFDVINLFTVQGMLLITHKDYGYETLEDFLSAAKEAKANGKTLTIGVNGEYGIWHQAGALMEEATGTDGAFNFIPFDSSAEQNSELLGKHLDAIVTSPTASIGHIEEGSMIGLGSMTDERMEALAEIPTFKELGYDVKYESWRALAVPKGTPEPILKKIKEAAKKAYDNPEFQKWATETNIDQVYMNSEDSEKYLEELYPVVENVIKKFGL